MSNSPLAAVDFTSAMAFDAMPATFEQPDWSDHSGLQLAALTTCPLVVGDPARNDGPLRLMGASRYNMTGGGKRHVFGIRPGFRWRDGSPLTAADYRDALLRAANSRTVTGYWLRHVERVQAHGDVLEVRLVTPDFGFPLLSALPALAPYRGRGEGVGKFRITAATQRAIVLSRADHDAAEACYGPRPDRLVVRRVKSPQRNLRAFEQHRVDVSSDTAFPYHRIPDYAADPAFRVNRTGVVVTLCFEGRLLRADAKIERLAVQRALTVDGTAARLPAPLMAKTTFLPTEDFDAAYRQALSRSPAMRQASARKTSLAPYRLAYDTYYPNERIARAVAAILREAGIPVELVPDRYENRTASAELRINLFRGLRSDPLGVYHGLVFLDTLRAHGCLNEYVHRLRAHDANPHTRENSLATARELDRILATNGLCVPLAEVPGIFLSRLSFVPWEWQ